MHYRRNIASKITIRNTLNALIEQNNYNLTADELFNLKYAKIKCKHRSGSRIREEATLYKYALERKDYTFLRETIATPGCHKTLDPRVWDMVDGKKENVVDFINVILSDADRADAEHDIGPLKAIQRLIKNCILKKEGKLPKQ